MKRIGIVENGEAAAVTREGSDHPAVLGRTSAANTISLKHLIGKGVLKSVAVQKHILW